MGLQTIKNARVVTSLINLTETDLNLYDQATGEIEQFPPQALPDIQSLCFSPHVGPSDIYFVVEDDDLREFKRKGYCLQDIAIVIGKSHGRGGILISYLATAEDVTKRIFLDRGAKRRRLRFY